MGERSSGGSGRRGQAQAYAQDLQRLLAGETARDNATPIRLRLLILNGDLLRAAGRFRPPPALQDADSLPRSASELFQAVSLRFSEHGTSRCFSFPAYGHLE
jgi:hypothetical protein